VQTTQQRGQQGRPAVSAPSNKTGEDRVREILAEHKAEIQGLLKDEKPDAAYERAVALSVAAYRNVQKSADESAAAQNKPTVRINEESTVSVCLFALQRKLDPGTDVYLVPYGGKVSPILSPKGVIKLMMRSGYVTAIQPPETVFRGDEFDYLLGTERWIKHKKTGVRPEAKKDGRGQVAANPAAWDAIEHVYVVIHLRGGEKVIEVLNKSEIAYHRSMSPSATSNYGGWAKFPEQFAEKTVLKQAAKWVPQEAEVSILLSSDDSERGIEIPDEIMRAVGARMIAEMVQDPQATAPQNGTPKPRESDKGSAPPAKTEPLAGDPAKIKMPGKAETAKFIGDADPADLAKWEGKIRSALDAGELDAPDYKWKAQDLRRLATIRARMRSLDMVVVPHEILDVGLSTLNPKHKRLSPEIQARGERTFQIKMAAKAAAGLAEHEEFPDDDAMTDDDYIRIIRENGGLLPEEEQNVQTSGDNAGYAD
jgi:phage RecT family recombinase